MDALVQDAHVVPSISAKSDVAVWEVGGLESERGSDQTSEEEHCVDCWCRKKKVGRGAESFAPYALKSQTNSHNEVEVAPLNGWRSRK